MEVRAGMRRINPTKACLKPAWPLAALGLLLAPGIACADPEDALNFTVSTAVRHDDNVFRLPSNVLPPAGLGKTSKSDRINVTTVGLKFDKAYSQQRFQFGATITDNRYDRFSNLDFEARGYQAAWLWRLTSRLSGSLKADRQQSLADFTDYRTGVATGRNVRTTENRLFNADWWLHGSWHLVGGISEVRQSNSQTFSADASYNLVSAEAGVKYVAESGNSLALLSRQGRGENPGRVLDPVAVLDNRFDNDEIELKLDYQITGKSGVVARVARVERKHEHFSARDYAGTAGRFDYTWKPLGKLQVLLSAGRDIASFQDANGSFFVNDSVSLTPVWQIGAKTAARLKLESSRRDYRGAVTPLAVSREDRVRSMVLSLDWKPLRALTLSASLQKDRRDSSLAAFDYKATVATITAQLAF